jgi:nitroreductase
VAFIDLIRSRRSIRDFTDRTVPKEVLVRCLEAARLAPSACNSQPWTFVVADDPDVKNQLAKAAFGGIYAMNRFCSTAGALVAVVSERANFLARIGGQFRGTSYYLIDVGIAIEHFVLQAEELGLGTCWIGWFSEPGVKRVLGIPKGRKVDILIAVGHARESATGSHDRVPLEEMSAFNSYPGN